MTWLTRSGTRARGQRSLAGLTPTSGPFDEGLQTPPAYRGKTYHAALTVGVVVLLVIGIALLVAAVA